MPENTTARDPMLHLLGAMSEGTSGYIDNMEAAGQRQLVASEDLPTTVTSTGRDGPFLEAGFTFGEPYPHDPLFRPATMPDGWTRQSADDARGSYLLDEHGRRRVSIFYKAAHYDRHAYMSWFSRYNYLNEVLYHGRTPVLDDTWLTAQAAVAELIAIRDNILEEVAEFDGFGREGGEYWSKRAEERRAEAAKAEALRAQIAEAV